jgi:hypothetical protein
MLWSNMLLHYTVNCRGGWRDIIFVNEFSATKPAKPLLKDNLRLPARESRAVLRVWSGVPDSLKYITASAA